MKIAAEQQEVRVVKDLKQIETPIVRKTIVSKNNRKHNKGRRYRIQLALDSTGKVKQINHAKW